MIYKFSPVNTSRLSIFWVSNSSKCHWWMGYHSRPHLGNSEHPPSPQFYWQEIIWWLPLPKLISWINLCQHFIVKKCSLNDLSSKYKQANFIFTYNILEMYIKWWTLILLFLLPLHMTRDITKDEGEERKGKIY